MRLMLFVFFHQKYIIWVGKVMHIYNNKEVSRLYAEVWPNIKDLNYVWGLYKKKRTNVTG